MNKQIHVKSLVFAGSSANQLKAIMWPLQNLYVSYLCIEKQIWGKMKSLHLKSDMQWCCLPSALHRPAHSQLLTHDNVKHYSKFKTSENT